MDHDIAHAEGKYHYQTKEMRDMIPQLGTQLERENEEQRERAALAKVTDHGKSLNSFLIIDLMEQRRKVM